MARTDAGLVVEARVVKSRRHAAGDTKHLWLRPGREQPLIFA